MLYKVLWPNLLKEKLLICFLIEGVKLQLEELTPISEIVQKCK